MTYADRSQIPRRDRSRPLSQACPRAEADGRSRRRTGATTPGVWLAAIGLRLRLASRRTCPSRRGTGGQVRSQHLGGPDRGAHASSGAPAARTPVRRVHGRLTQRMKAPVPTEQDPRRGRAGSRPRRRRREGHARPPRHADLHQQGEHERPRTAAVSTRANRPPFDRAACTCDPQPGPDRSRAADGRCGGSR